MNTDFFVQRGAEGAKHFNHGFNRQAAEEMDFYFYFAENESAVVLLKVSPGRRMVEGKLV
jgi:hypothetical protein